MGKRTVPLVKTLNPAAVVDLDVSSDAQIEAAVKEVSKVWDSVDVLVHSIGYAPREALDGRFVDVTTREAWRITLEVSAYSLIALARAFRPLMKPGSAIVTLTYLGSERVVTNYNVMGVAKAALEASTRYLAEDLGRDGIRVNAISAGPLKTLAAAGIKGMRTMLSENAAKTPLRRNIDHDEVGKAALFLCSDMGSGITGEVMYVDAGQNIMGPVQMGSGA
jgi:enoyl-[acyl-carrier protein] reductase I